MEQRSLRASRRAAGTRHKHKSPEMAHLLLAGGAEVYALDANMPLVGGAGDGDKFDAGALVGAGASAADDVGVGAMASERIDAGAGAGAGTGEFADAGAGAGV